MKIVLTGGGTGGHFYPIIAVAEALHTIVDQEKIIGLKLYYFSNTPYDKQALFENTISYTYVPAGKLRVYASSRNILDFFKTGIGTLSALVSLFFNYPDVVFCKGGYGSFPVVLAARILRIPVVVHESDSMPGRVNKWAGKFAQRVALSFAEAAPFFPKDKVAVTGQPIREVLKERKPEGAFEYLKLNPTIPTILVLGGSQGAETLNNSILDSLPELLKKYQVIHSTGPANFSEVNSRANFLLDKTNLLERYRPFPLLNPLALKMAAGAATLVISRAGSSIFEIASWGLPSILVPLPSAHDDHQRKNAFNYARHGGATVIEESNLSPTILISEISRIFEDTERTKKMSEAARAFASPQAAHDVARALVDIALSHER